MQFILYLFVGGASFLVDIGTFVGLRQVALAVIPASVASFVLATLANYLLCRFLVFAGDRYSTPMELSRFLFVVLVGLLLNTALVWGFVYLLHLLPTLGKIAAVPIALIWNYLGRRFLVFDHRLPRAGHLIVARIPGVTQRRVRIVAAAAFRQKLSDEDRGIFTSRP
jgi:putative flippase GtrA